MHMGPDPMDFGVSLGGANAIYTITDARSSALLTARISDDTSHGQFHIARLTSYTLVRDSGAGGELPPGHHGPVFELEENDSTDGSRPLQVDAHNTVDIDVSFNSTPGSADRLTATLIIEDASSPRHWPPYQTHLIAHVCGITTILPSTVEVHRGDPL